MRTASIYYLTRQELRIFHSMNTVSKKQSRSRNFDRFSDPTLIREFAYVNGEWHAGDESKPVDVTNPADGSWIGEVASLSPAQSCEAIKAANEAFSIWSKMLPQKRSELLRNWFELMIQNKEDLATMMTLEQGKPLSESRGEIDYAASFLEFYAEEAKRPNIEGITSHLEQAEMEVWREPVGVVGLITPWNFPSAMITRKAGAALAAGCTTLIHPSRETPFSALMLAELSERAGIPQGVFNVLTGDAQAIVAAWMQSPLVRAVSFTGSTEVGRMLYRQSAATVKKVVMELGGHAPLIVFADADLELAVKSALSAKFATSGQDCLAANRIYIERPVYDEFCKRFADAASALKVGNGLDDPDIGPLMNDKAVAKQVEHIDDALNKGAILLTGGSNHPAGRLFFQPTVLSDVADDALLFREETFGPVAGITAFDTEEEALGRANDTEYGLVSYVHTNNAQRIYRLTRALQFGMVAVNRTKVTGAPIPFGGMKQSGIGREGSRLGMEEFTEIKYVCRNYE
jgi:aspartate-semialdehyde dehydrogenase